MEVVKNISNQMLILIILILFNVKLFLIAPKLCLLGMGGKNHGIIYWCEHWNRRRTLTVCTASHESHSQVAEKFMESGDIPNVKKEELLFSKFLLINQGKARIISVGCRYLIDPTIDSYDTSRMWILLWLASANTKFSTQYRKQKQAYNDSFHG